MAVLIPAVPAHERPRERLLARGVESLNETELLALILRNGTAGAERRGPWRPSTPSSPDRHRASEQPHVRSQSGAGRIVRLRMRPLSLAERGLPEPPTVSLKDLLTGSRPKIAGHSSLDLAGYTTEILASGFPAIRKLVDVGLATQSRTRLDPITELLRDPV